MNKIEDPTLLTLQSRMDNRFDRLEDKLDSKSDKEDCIREAKRNDKMEDKISTMAVKVGTTAAGIGFLIILAGWYVIGGL